MVEGMRADCLIVDSTAREEPCPLTWAHCLDPGIPLASQPGQPRQLYSQPAANSFPGLQKAPQKSIKSSLESSKFVKMLKKQNLLKTAVFIAF